MNLFEWRHKQDLRHEAPLAARMRPRTLDEFVGQHALIGPGRLLRRAIQADQLSSLLFHGPPGTGKTTLARIIANTTSAHFTAINAVLAGVKDLRAAIQEAQERRVMQRERTILFVDEVHRFNKSQQDALLPWVENGTVVLIGATTENPYFEVNKALVSRSRIFQLTPLEASDLHTLVEHALTDKERGYGQRQIQLDENAQAHLIHVANGDARTLLNALELAVETTAPNAEGLIHIDLAVAEESIQQRAVLYDKDGDAHFDTISAFIKSVRGSDPDAALFWLAKMVYAGEDPRFLFRRLLILASEDIGMADPIAISVVEGCAATFDRIGMPEGRYPLAQATIYLATAPKSNSTMGFFDALKAIQQEDKADVPNHLKDPNRDKKATGHGVGYLYPHAYRDHWVAQQYLPTHLQNQIFYQPSTQGFEGQIHDRVARQREAQLAALVEQEPDIHSAVFTYSPTDKAQERWHQRTQSQAGQRLAQVRSQLFEYARPARHHVWLDLQATSGLLTWEALRQSPEGGVYTRATTTANAEAIRQQAQALPALQHPTIWSCSLEALPAHSQAHDPALHFDRIIGRNLCQSGLPSSAWLRSLRTLLAPQALCLLAETVPAMAQRLYALLDPGWLSEHLYQALREAEEATYTEAEDKDKYWTPQRLEARFDGADWPVTLHMSRAQNQVQVTKALLARWFPADLASAPHSYAAMIAQSLSPAQCTEVAKLFHTHLCDRPVSWESTTLFLIGRASASADDSSP